MSSAKQLIFKSYPANKGDSFLLSWDTTDGKSHLLIDSGTPGTYKSIREDLKSLDSLSAVIITHVDYDHVGGFLKWLSDDHLKLTGYDIFVNTPQLILTPSKSDKVGIEHGVQLDNLLKEKQITPKSLFVGFNEDSKLLINGLNLQILSPTKEILSTFLEHWKAEAIYQNYITNSNRDSKVARPPVNKLTYSEIIEKGATNSIWQVDVINASSIAFIAAYKDVSILFLGDSNPSVIANELKNLGYSETSKLKISLCKLSHHGSRANTNRELLSILDCNSFYISTDGMGANFHPDRETIVRIAEYSRSEVSQQLKFYTNYKLDLQDIITQKERDDWNVQIEHQEKMVFNF